ncbi:hypothetical protein [Ureibacillus sinduriensis]|nr:hypothetical protein [Ureibacillus sinduriensis]
MEHSFKTKGNEGGKEMKKVLKALAGVMIGIAVIAIVKMIG